MIIVSADGPVPLGARQARWWPRSGSRHISRVSCQKGPSRHAYAWQIYRALLAGYPRLYWSGTSKARFLRPSHHIIYHPENALCIIDPGGFPSHRANNVEIWCFLCGSHDKPLKKLLSWRNLTRHDCPVTSLYNTKTIYPVVNSLQAPIDNTLSLLIKNWNTQYIFAFARIWFDNNSLWGIYSWKLKRLWIID